MAFAHAPLPDAALGTEVLRVVGPAAPAPIKGMVARGQAPLGPRDLLTALYQLWVKVDDREISDAAGATVESMPAQMLLGVLGEAKLAPGVLDLIARKHLHDVPVLERLVRHPAVDDETLVGLARVCPESICEVLADNQTRWLRTPAIAESLYFNRACRMSTINRVIELADREGVDLRIPMFEDIKQAVRHEGTDPDRDRMFRAMLEAGEDADAVIERLRHAHADEAVDLEIPEMIGDDVYEPMPDPADVPVEPLAPDEEAEPDPLAEAIARTAEAGDVEVPLESLAASRESRLGQLVRMRPSEKIRVALLGDAYDRSVLIRDANRVVSMAVIRSPKIKETEIVGYSANRSMSHDVIRYICNRREWTKLYTVKLNLVMNPKTPMAKAMTMLPFLHATDVKKVARSKNIPSALAQAARRKDAARK